MNQPALNKLSKNRNSGCARLLTTAEQELAAFFNAVKELFGLQQAQLSADDWLNELLAVNCLPASAREWRQLTIKVEARLVHLYAREAHGLPSPSAFRQSLIESR